MSTINNGKIFYGNVLEDAGIITATTEETGFEVQYIANNNQGVVWRSTALLNQHIVIPYNLETEIKGVVILNHNLTIYDSATLEATDSEAQTYTQSLTNFDGGFVEVDWPLKTYTEFRLKLNKASGTYIQVGEVYLFSGSYEFERNFKWNYSYTREINRNSKQTTSGQVYRKTRFIRKGFNMEFEGMTDVQKERFETISENDYICFLPTGVTGELHYGIIDFSSYTHVYDNFWDASMTFMENPV